MRRQALLALFTLGCLEVPHGLRLPDPVSDGGVPAAPHVAALAVTDHNANGWPEDGIPQLPTIDVAISEPPFDFREAPVFLFLGPPDPELLEDLASEPLRASSEERLVAASVESTASGWVLAASERLAPGEVVTLAAGAWVRGMDSGLEMGAPFARALIVSTAPDAGASATGSWPADGAAAVPPSIPMLAVRFDGFVSGVEDGVVLRLDGARVAATVRTETCEALGWSDGQCAAIVPDAPLEPSRAYEISIGAGVVDATGAPVGPWSARFSTAAYDDVEPPSLLDLPCALDETATLGACVLADDARIDVRVQASEPVRLALVIDGGTLLAVAPRGSAILSARSLRAATAYEAMLRSSDLAGRVMELPLALSTTEPLLPISIVEVRADPLGPEPRQEYVEVLNYGAVPVELHDLSLSDSATALGDVVPYPSLSLAPGQRALLVPDDFDPDDPADPVPVPPAVPLVRVGRSLGSGGITNGGEPLFLRDALLRRLSSSPALMAPSGSCIVRRSEEPRTSEGFAVAPCSPGL